VVTFALVMVSVLVAVARSARRPPLARPGRVGGNRRDGQRRRAGTSLQATLLRSSGTWLMVIGMAPIRTSRRSSKPAAINRRFGGASAAAGVAAHVRHLTTPLAAMSTSRSTCACAAVTVPSPSRWAVRSAAPAGHRAYGSRSCPPCRADGRTWWWPGGGGGAATLAARLFLEFATDWSMPRGAYVGSRRVVIAVVAAALAGAVVVATR
jgi:hypothetical protein